MPTLSTASRSALMTQSARQLFVGAAVALFFALTLATFAQTPPAAPAAPVAPEQQIPAAAPASAPAAPAPEVVAPTPPAATPAPAPVAETTTGELRNLTAAPGAPTAASDDSQPTRRPRRAHRGDNDRVSVMGDTHVEAGELIEGAAVGVMGDVTVDGEVTGDAVAVLGSNTVNGTVRGNVVAVLGDVTLGPKAKVGGDIVCITGTVKRAPGAEVGGKIIKKTVGNNKHLGPNFDRWLNEGFKPARMLGFSPAFNWAWVLTLFLLAFYVVLALVFPGGVRKTGDMLVKRPVATVMSAMLSILALPVLFILLLITVVGIPVAVLFLPIAIVVGVIFGKAAIYGLVGRGLTADKFHPALAVLIGATLFVILYLVPVAGVMLSLLTAFLGLGCVMTALLGSEKKTVPVAATAAQAVPPPMPAATPMAADVTAPPMAFAAAAGPAGVPPVFMPAPMAAPPPPVSEVPPASAAMPRAGFWIRTGALFIDGVIIAVCFGPWAGPAVLPILALYGALMWKFRGTTVGGIVCGLQVVRLDDRPLDWPTAVVRALGCFLSLAVIGLGFVWVAFDDEKQSWHDKIAGTTVVRPQKRISLV
jgi:uncharacterized RDD family membrane protein YckC/cytoskeletal protein CcmA (bactofilin family)